MHWSVGHTVSSSALHIQKTGASHEHIQHMFTAHCAAAAPPPQLSLVLCAMHPSGSETCLTLSSLHRLEASGSQHSSQDMHKGVHLQAVKGGLPFGCCVCWPGGRRAAMEESSTALRNAWAEGMQNASCPGVILHSAAAWACKGPSSCPT